MEDNKYIIMLRQNWVGISFVAIILFIIFVVSQFSFVQINAKPVTENTEATYNYYITTSKDGKTTESHSNVPTFRKLVRRGSYTVSATQNETSYFAFVKTGGFFTTKTIDAQLVSEKSRTFVGDNPDACMQYVDTVLLSYSCNGLMRTVKVHAPASATQATFVKTVDGSGDTILGSTKTKEGTVVLVETVAADSDGVAPLLTTIGKDGKLSTTGSYPSQLSNAKTYELTPYREGFIIYDTSFNDIYYFASVTADPEKISIQRPKNSKLLPYSFTTSGEAIIGAYADEQSHEAEDVHDEAGTGGTSTLAIVENGKTKQLNMAGVFSDMVGCGTKKVCVINKNNLHVYDISGKKARLVYTIPDVQDVAVSGDKLIVVTQVNVLAIDTDKGSGSVAYSFGDYTYCGIETDQSGYTLCMINYLQRKVALRIDPTTANINSIDKKISELQHSKAVKTVSAYHNFIAIEPNYGQQVYEPSQKIYTYEPSVVKRMNETLEQDLARIGLDRQTYSISGTL